MKNTLRRSVKMRPIWSGALSFGLVNIPVKLYSAIESESKINFDLLHKEDLSPIRYSRVCKREGKEVPYEDIVKGYEYQKGDYVVVSEEEFEKINITRTKTIEVVGFVEEKQIDSIYFEKPYFLEPDKTAGKSYALLREALKRSGKVGLARYVLRNREHIGVLKPFQQGIMLEQIHFDDELRRQDNLKLPEENVDSREVEVALALIEQLSQDFEPDKFKDTYRKELLDLIQKKIEGKPLKPQGEAPKATEVGDLMAILKESLDKAKAK
jgi:DNA end-binding protein Ku